MYTAAAALLAIALLLSMGRLVALAVGQDRNPDITWIRKTSPLRYASTLALGIGLISFFNERYPAAIVLLSVSCAVAVVSMYLSLRRPVTRSEEPQQDVRDHSKPQP
jgi:putative exporter of polyketide antibiotics